MKIALHEVITPGNIGAVARAMKNFGFTELLLIKPQCNHQSEEAFQRACHAPEILEQARVITEEELFTHFVIGTTSLASKRGPHRKAITPRDLKEYPKNAVLLFGREDHGLNNELLKQCDMTMTIPTGTDYSSLNLSHAVTIALYELRSARVKEQLISKELRQALINSFYELIELTERDESLKGYIDNFVNRSIIYQKEGQALIGLLKQLKKQLG